MRDLYERLGLGFGADAAALRRAALAAADDELRRRTERVLLAGQRRAAHDAVYRVARRLRDWRVELHLEDGAWAKALTDSDLVRPDLPSELLQRPQLPPPPPWWQRLFRR